ncbi:MAG: HEAT repeat domain-containing protein [Acidimicrobiales bacterium]
MTEHPAGRNDPTTRKRTVVLAGHRGDSEVARAHLDDPDPGVRASAVAALARCGSLTPAELEGTLADPVPDVRRRGIEVAATTASVHSQQIDLVRLLADDDDRVVEAAAWGLGELQPPDAVEPLCALVSGHPDSLVREAAVAALGAIGDAGGLQVILAATTDIATVRRRAVIALAPFEGPEVDAALERARTDRDWQVRQAAEDLLAPPPESHEGHPDR